MEAEYMTAFGAIQELIWLKGGAKWDRNTLGWSNNIEDGCQECNRISEESCALQNAASTSIIKYHWLREHPYEDGTIYVEHCVTEDMVADVMTKALPFDLHLHSKHAKNITGNGNVK